MARGRPPGSKNKPKLSVVGGGAAGPGHNSLSDKDEQALHFVHVRDYEKALAEKKTADANFKNVAKRIKAEGGSVDDVKLTIQLRSPEGEKALKELMERQLRVARWNNLPVGTQAALFDEDRRPIEERAAAEGKKAGMEGKTLEVPNIYPPDSPAGQAFIKGWHEGQAAIFNIKPKDKPSAELLRPEAEAASDDRDVDDALAGEDRGGPEESGREGEDGDWPDGASGDADLRPNHLQNGGDQAAAE
jgi:hypothetical protein